MKYPEITYPLLVRDRTGYHDSNWYIAIYRMEYYQNTTNWYTTNNIGLLIYWYATNTANIYWFLIYWSTESIKPFPNWCLGMVLPTSVAINSTVGDCLGIPSHHLKGLVF